jgi:two-component system LytT family response regulator
MTPLTEQVRVILVDDEKEACTNLKNLLFEYVDPDIVIAGVAHNTRQAETLINKLAPDAVFLDIEMPNENAFHFLDRIKPFKFEVIFVTAYDEYAVRAFKLNAIDYILKPISINELSSAVSKLKERLHVKQLLHNNYVSFSDLSKQVKDKNKNQKITFRDGSGIEVVDFRDILYMEANGSYSLVLFKKDGGIKELTMSVSLSDYEDLLPTDLFYRIHKSYLINCMHIKKVLKEDISQVVIQGGYHLPVSRRRFPAMLDFLKSNKFIYE